MSTLCATCESNARNDIHVDCCDNCKTNQTLAEDIYSHLLSITCAYINDDIVARVKARAAKGNRSDLDMIIDTLLPRQTAEREQIMSPAERDLWRCSECGGRDDSVYGGRCLDCVDKGGC